MAVPPRVAMVEDYNSEIQETVPSSRRQAFKQRVSMLQSVTNISDPGTVDSGYSSNSAHGIGEEHESYNDHDHDHESPSRNTPQSDLSASATSERTPQARPNGSNLESEGRQSRASNPHRISGRYAYVNRVDRPLSRTASKSNRNRPSSPAMQPINTSGNDDCDCSECANKLSASAHPSPSMLPPSASKLEHTFNMDGMLNSLPPYNTQPSGWDDHLSSSPSKSKGYLRESNGFFDTFTTTPSGRPSSLLSSSNPLAGFQSAYDYTASPTAYTPSGLDSLHSPAPYLGIDDHASWVQPMSGMPPTPTSYRGSGLGVDDYLSYSSDYLYGSGSGAHSATGANHSGYDLPPRSASVQPSGLKPRARSHTYTVDHSMGPPPLRNKSRAPPGPRRLHSTSNSYDGRYDNSLPYDRYEPTFDHANPDDMQQPPPPINRRLSRTAASGPGALPPLDITRATSVPPADNYLVSLDRARRQISMTPQPLAIQQRERNRRPSNASSGMSASARRAHDARLAEMADMVVVEPRPELALTKRESAGAIVKHGYAPEYDYGLDGGYGGYDYPYDNSATLWPLDTRMGYLPSYNIPAATPIGHYA